MVVNSRISLFARRREIRSSKGSNSLCRIDLMMCGGLLCLQGSIPEMVASAKCQDPFLQLQHLFGVLFSSPFYP